MPAPRLPDARLQTSSSPDQSVGDEGWGRWSGRCAGCLARSDPGPQDVAWRWVDEHRCGVASLRLA